MVTRPASAPKMYPLVDCRRAAWLIKRFALGESYFRMRRRVLFVVCGLVASSVAAYTADGLNTIAAKYAHLVLALGQHDPDYVDAFYGPAPASGNMAH